MSTKSSNKPRRRLLHLAVLAALGGGALAPASASAASLYWVCGSNVWDSITSCWSTAPGGAGIWGLRPANGDDVFLTQTDATNRSISFRGPVSPVALNSLSIDATGTGTMTLSQGSISISSPLATSYEYVGINGTGIHTQGVSTNTVSNALYLGYNSGGNGTYNLGGGGLLYGVLSGNFEFIGYSGAGTFNQTDGTNTASTALYIGTNSGGNGTYNLSAGSLSAASEYIGTFSASTGAFNQSGGTNTVSANLYLGYLGGSSGSYTLSAGSLSAHTEVIGRFGTGVFTQTGGTHTVSNDLTLGFNSGSSGSYTLSGGTLNVGGIAKGAGASTFILDGGTLNLTGNSISLGFFRIGNAAGSNGSFTLGVGKTLSTDGIMIGNLGTGAFTQSGGTYTTGGFSLGLYSNGSYNLSAGSLSASIEGIGGLGAGAFTQSGGTNTVAILRLGDFSGGNGSYTLSGTGSLSAGWEVIGDSGTGAFTQSGGTHTASNFITLGDSGNGSYTLSGTGNLSANSETIGNYGTGVFTQSGGTHTIGGTLTLGAASGGNGTYNLSGGTLNVGNIADGPGASAFNLNGGTLNLTGSSISLDDFGIGNAASSNGSFTLGSGQTLAASNETIGHNGTGAFTQNGGTHTVSGGLTLGGPGNGNGTYNLIAGNLSANHEEIGWDAWAIGGSTGTINQSGGTHTVETLSLGGFWSRAGTGAYNLSAGSLSVNNWEHIGGNGTGAFTQSGGTHTVSGLFLNSDSTYNLSAGSLSAGSEIIGNWGAGAFTQSGGTHTVTGTMTLAAISGGTGTYNLTGGALTVNGGITNNAGGSFFASAGTTATVGGTGFVNHGLLGGAGTIAGNIISDGTVGPGSSPGMLSITGNYTQSALGTYTVEIGGLLAGTQYDVLNVTGTAFLDGLLNVSLFDLGSGLFTPHAGDHFDILTADILFGSFSSLSFAALSDPNLFWRIDYLTDAIGTTDVVRLSVAQHVTPPPPVPEPETYAMLLAGLGLMGFAGRRRRNSVA